MTVDYEEHVIHLIIIEVLVSGGELEYNMFLLFCPLYLHGGGELNIRNISVLLNICNIGMMSFSAISGITTPVHQ